jgi:PAS domain S-box-containing protein
MGTGLPLWGRHRDGHEFPVDVSRSPLPVIGEADDAFAVICTIRDQPERLQLAQAQSAAAAARQESERLVTIIEAMPDAVGVYDAECHLVRANSVLRRLRDLDADAVYGAHPPEERARRVQLRHPDGSPIPPEENGVTRLPHGDVQTATEPWEVVLTTLDGREVWLSVTSAQLRDGAGQIVGAVAALRDVTESRRLEQEQAELLGIVGHDLTTPLTTMKARVQLLQRRLAGGERLPTNALDAVGHSVLRLERLVGDLRAKMSLEASQLTPELE